MRITKAVVERFAWSGVTVIGVGVFTGCLAQGWTIARAGTAAVLFSSPFMIVFAILQTGETIKQFRQDARGSFAILLPGMALAAVAVSTVKLYFRQSGMEKAQRIELGFWFAVAFTGLCAFFILLLTVLRVRQPSRH